MEQMNKMRVKIGKVLVKTMLIIIAIILLSIAVLIGLIFINSSDKAKPFLDANGEIIKGSISEKIFIEINSVKQGMFIKGKDKTKPVLLFLHGGPGVTEQWVNQIYPSGIEDEFVVCWWEQRGAGISNNDESSPEMITNEQLVDDTIAVSNYLRERFNQDKIYIMGHSWGSALSVCAIDKAPDLFHAYISIAQATYHLEAQKVGYDYMLNHFKQTGNTKMVNKLLQNPYTIENPFSEDYKSIADEVIHKAGCGTTREMKSIITGVFVPSFFAKEYTFSEKINLWRGKWSTYATRMGQQFDMTDYRKFNEFKIPVYFLQGKYDYTTAYPMVKDYVETIKAPIKGFYTFHESAHSPIFEEPEKFMKIMKEDVLKGTNHLSDKI